jgi:hypothetical protein
MTKAMSKPLISQIWLVVQENEGLVIDAFTKQSAAVARPRQLARKCPSMRTEVAKFLIAVNSCKSFGATHDVE